MLTVLFPFLTIYSHLSMSQTYKLTVKAKKLAATVGLRKCQCLMIGYARTKGLAEASEVLNKPNCYKARIVIIPFFGLN